VWGRYYPRNVLWASRNWRFLLSYWSYKFNCFLVVLARRKNVNWNTLKVPLDWLGGGVSAAFGGAGAHLSGEVVFTTLASPTSIHFVPVIVLGAFTFNLKVSGQFWGRSLNTQHGSTWSLFRLSRRGLVLIATHFIMALVWTVATTSFGRGFGLDPSQPTFAYQLLFRVQELSTVVPLSSLAGKRIGPSISAPCLLNNHLRSRFWPFLLGNADCV